MPSFERDAALVWPDAGLEVIDELKAHPGRVALVEQTNQPRQILTDLADLIEADCLSVGRRIASHAQPPSTQAVLECLVGHPFLYDLDVLFSPVLSLDPGAVLRELARRATPLVAAWPGQLQNSRAVYSKRGRHDYYERRLSDVVILRPVETTFPDECPFTIERWSV